MEKEIKLKTKDGYLIYGVLNTPSKKTNKLLIFVHGLGGNSNEHIFYNAARYFTKKGIATFRFDLYSDWKKARRLQKCTISTHAGDLGQVANYFYPKYKKLYVAGHSLGGLTILLSDTHFFHGLVLWDPSHSKRLKGVDLRYSKKNNSYLLDWGIEILFGKKMYKEWNNLPDSNQFIKNIQRPIKIISAGKNYVLRSICKEYFKHANKPKAFAVVQNAYHNFNEWGTEEELFEETWKWVKKF